MKINSGYAPTGPRRGPQLQYLGGALADTSQLSPQTRDAIDSEIQRIIDAQFVRAQHLLTEHRAALESLTVDLLKNETLMAALFDSIAVLRQRSEYHHVMHTVLDVHHLSIRFGAHIICEI